KLKALSKQAAYPAAKSCSGLVCAPPLPPNSRGVLTSRSSTPSEDLICPFLPPVALAVAVYNCSIFSITYVFQCLFIVFRSNQITQLDFLYADFNFFNIININEKTLRSEEHTSE